MTILDADTYLEIFGRLDERRAAGPDTGLDLGKLETDVLAAIEASGEDEYGPRDWTRDRLDPDDIAWGTVFRRSRREIEASVKFIGRGSSRLAFILEDGRCLKVAWNRAGLAQNLREYATIGGMDFSRYSFLPRAYSVAGSGAWMLEDCYGAMSPGIWRDLFGMSLFDVMDSFETVMKWRRKRPGESWLEYGEAFLGDHSGDEPARMFFRGLDDGGAQWKSVGDILEWYWDDPSRVSDMSPRDLSQLDNWGFRDVEGETQVVVIDAGLSERIYNDYYSL